MRRTNYKFKELNYLKGTACLLLSLFFAQNALAENTIQLAQNAFLNKQRKQAIGILVTELQKDNLLKAKKQKLNKTLERVSTMFFTEKAIKKYGLAESVLYTDAKLSVLTLLEITKTEPNHAKVESLLATNYLTNRQCKKAKSVLSESLQINPFNDKLKMLLLNALLCLEDYEQLTTQLASATGRSKTLEFNHLMAVYSLKTQDEGKYKYYLDQLKKTPKQPVYVVLQKRLAKKGPEYAERVKAYIKVCSQKDHGKLFSGLFFYCDFIDEMIEEQASLDKEESLSESE